MGKQPAFQFYPGDWVQDTRILTPLTRGVWIDMLCFMWRANERGKLDGTVLQLSRLLSCQVSEIETAINELRDTKIAEVSVTGNAEVTPCNDFVTVINRRMYREERERILTRSRVARYRETQEKRSCSDEVTPPSSSSSSSSCTKVHLEESSNDDSSCPPPEIFITIPLNDKTEYLIDISMIEEWKNLFPKIDVEQCLRNIRAWNLSHPKERKTKAGILKHVTGWLAREQDKGGNGNENSSNRPGFTGGARQALGKAGNASSDGAPWPEDRQY